MEVTRPPETSLPAYQSTIESQKTIIAVTAWELWTPRDEPFILTGHHRNRFKVQSAYQTHFDSWCQLKAIIILMILPRYSHEVKIKSPWLLTERHQLLTFIAILLCCLQQPMTTPLLRIVCISGICLPSPTHHNPHTVHTRSRRTIPQVKVKVKISLLQAAEAHRVARG
jgi:hypothetical protein